MKRIATKINNTVVIAHIGVMAVVGAYVCIDIEADCSKEEWRHMLRTLNEDKAKLKELYESNAPIEDLALWEEAYKPIDTTKEGYETFVEYNEALALAKTFNPANPQFHVWSRVEGSDGTLILLNGFRIVNRLDYCVTERAWGDDPKGSDYVEVWWENKSDREMSKYYALLDESCSSIRYVKAYAYTEEDVALLLEEHDTAYGIKKILDAEAFSEHAAGEYLECVDCVSQFDHFEYTLISECNGSLNRELHTEESLMGYARSCFGFADGNIQDAIKLIEQPQSHRLLRVEKIERRSAVCA